jgi:hypothetical protein
MDPLVTVTRFVPVLHGQLCSLTGNYALSALLGVLKLIATRELGTYKMAPTFYLDTTVKGFSLTTYVSSYHITPSTS